MKPQIELFLIEAYRWRMVREEGGNNQGQIVRLFQEAVNGKAEGEPWCAGFVHFCLNAVNRQAAVYGGGEHKVRKSEWVKSIWENTMQEYKGLDPQRGCLAVWRSDGDNGHIGVVLDVYSDGRIRTLEGNTESNETGNQRDGGGVYEKTRDPRLKIGNMTLVGYIYPWGREVV